MTDATPMLSVRNLTYHYRARAAVENLTFDVDRRSIHGFVGPNGAGKTTTLKIIATLLKPGSGSVMVDERDVVRQSSRVRRIINYMPDHFGLYPQMTVDEYLDFFAAAYGISHLKRGRVIADVLELTDMRGRRKDLLRSLSLGMQQRVSLARVLINNPQLLLLDEPASGLDPRARIELMSVLGELRDMGKTIFISSHILSELSDLCDSVTIIDRGRVKYTGTMQGLLSRSTEGNSYLVRLSERAAGLEALRALDHLSVIQEDANDPALVRLSFDPEQLSTNRVLEALLKSGSEVLSFSADERQLNQVFLDLTEPGVRD